VKNLIEAGGEVVIERHSRLVAIISQPTPRRISAMDLEFSVAAANERHYRLIPGLRVMMVS